MRDGHAVAVRGRTAGGFPGGHSLARRGRMDKSVHGGPLQRKRVTAARIRASSKP
jgi:hypothetical protein